MSMNAKSYNKFEEKKLPEQEPLPNDSYPATVAWIINMGLHPQMPWKGQAKEPKDKWRVAYQINGHFCKDEDGNEDEKLPVFLSETFPMNGLYSDQAKSTQRYKAIDPNEEYDGDWSKLVGKPCVVDSEQNPVGDRVYVNVSTVRPTMKMIPHTPLVNEGIVFDFYNPDLETWDRLPKFIKDICKEALNYEGSKLQEMLGDVESKEEIDSNDETGGLV
jgi:hypothetical protein